MTTHADLVRMAEAATPGPWKHVNAPDDSYGTPINRVDPDDGSGAAIGFGENCFKPEVEFANFAHIATWHPARALAALAVIEAAEHWRDGAGKHGPRERDENALLDALATWNALNDPEGSE